MNKARAQTITDKTKKLAKQRVREEPGELTYKMGEEQHRNLIWFQWTQNGKKRNENVAIFSATGWDEMV